MSGDPTRREFVAASAATTLTLAASRRAGGPAGRRAEAVELEEATVAGLQAAMGSGAVTSAGLCAAYLQRIDAIDRSGPTLRAVIELNPEAITIAEALDGVIAPRDAFFVTRLRAAGAVILGKTNLSEWANFRSTRSSSGWSGRGGQCRNPYALDRNPCGSSSGTGAAISANLATVGIGTETDGSIVCPSNANGLVGLKPTVGLVSRSGIIPISHTQDTAGPMCRTVADVAVLLTAIAGSDPEDSATGGWADGRTGGVDYTTFLDANGLKGARIGVARSSFWGYSPETDRLCEAALQALRDAGAVLVDPADIPHAGEYDGDEFQVLLYEFKADLNAYLRDWAPTAPTRTLADLIAFNERERAREMPYFGQELFEMAQEKGPLTEQEYVDALEKCGRLSRTEGIDAVMAEHRVDAIVAPTGSPAWPTDLVNGDHFTGASSTPGAVSGYPHISVPVGTSFGLPVGLTFLGTRWSEGTLLRLAYAFEQATRARTVPRFLPTADLTVR